MFVFPFLPTGGNEVPHRFHGVGLLYHIWEYYICWWFFILLTGQYFGFLLWHLGVSSHVPNIYRGGTFIELWGGHLTGYLCHSLIYFNSSASLFLLMFFMFCFCFHSVYLLLVSCCFVWCKLWPVFALISWFVSPC
jgi:hypothetical protein